MTLVKLKETAKASWPIVKSVLTHKVTYRFLIVLLAALGVSRAPDIGATLQDLATVLFGSLQ